MMELKETLRVQTHDYKKKCTLIKRSQVNNFTTQASKCNIQWNEKNGKYHTVVAVILWQLDLQLQYICNQCPSPLTLRVRIPFKQGVLGTTLCTTHKFVSDLRQVCGFLRVFRLPPPIKLTASIWLKYCWKWR